MQTSEILPTILNESKLSPAKARYWKAKAKQLAGHVDMLDPFRTSLVELRARFSGVSVYRASTGGRWGKSAQIVRL